MHILYVDDDSDDHLFFKEAIRTLGPEIHVTHLYDGSQLIDYLFRSGPYKSHSDPEPDLILIDVNMPVMNGVTCLRTIKSINQFRDIPVYILSTSNDSGSLAECIKLGAAGYYMKPILIKDLEKLVHEIVRRVEVSSDASKR